MSQQSKKQEFVIHDESTIAWLMEALMIPGFFDRKFERRFSSQEIDDASTWLLSDDPIAKTKPVLTLTLDLEALEMSKIDDVNDKSLLAKHVQEFRPDYLKPVADGNIHLPYDLEDFINIDSPTPYQDK